jgi:hypothetical protein
VVYNAVARVMDEACSAGSEGKKQVLEKVRRLKELMERLVQELEGL